MNIIYAGTPEFALPALQALIESRHQVTAVYTQPDRPAGRGRKLQMSPVKALALEHGLPVMQPLNFKQSVDIDALRRLDADLMIVAAYGLLLPKAVLEAPRLGCVNIHASLLPRWRGAAPIQRAILAGDRRTGITLMQMDEGLDTGDMLATAGIDIEPAMTAAALHDRLKDLGAELLMSSLERIEAGNLVGQPQDAADATYATKLTRDEAAVDWSRDAVSLQREVCAFNPWPVAHSSWQGKNFKIWSASAMEGRGGAEPGRVVGHDRQGIRVSCGEGLLNITELQVAGRKRQSAAQMLNAICLEGERLGA